MLSDAGDTPTPPFSFRGSPTSVPLAAVNAQEKSPDPDAPPDGGDRPTFRGLDLYPFQVEAIRSIDRGHSVLVAAPTGAGKTLVADYAIEAAFTRDERIVYTSPVKALSNQKFRDFREIHGDDVGIMTGDVTINATAPLLIMTTEVFRNTIFEDPARLDSIGTVIYDEIHYLDDVERGTVWEESIIYAPKHIRVIGLSATIPNIQDLADWMAQVRESTFDVVVKVRRPVPLRHFIYMPKMGPMSLKKLKGLVKAGRIKSKRGNPKAASRDLMDTLQKDDLLPCLYFCFSRKECEHRARETARRLLLTGAERDRILELYDDLCDRYQVPTDALYERVRGFVARGIMYHHAGLMPIYKEIVERLFTSGLIRVLFATETFALGVNMPARCVAFQSLRKFDGVSFDYMKTRDYYQMAGRAGRQGIDEVGFVYSLLDPRDIDIEKLSRIYHGKTEPVMSRFNLDYSAVLSLYERLGERVPEAYAHSFAHFLRSRQSRGDRPARSGKKRRRKRQPRESRLIRQRLKVLKRLGYIEDGALTAKGRFASKINGYEVQAAELLHYGLFHLADEYQLCVLMAAIVFEERRGNISSRLDDAILQEIKPLTEKKVSEFRRCEFQCGLDDLTQDVNFGLSAPVFAWARGAAFEDLRGLTNISDGDIVRNLRLTIQIMRNVRNALVDEPEIRKKFEKAMDMINRDEVDAKRQLELG
jgi:superfamily II RNA helicase